MRRDDPAAFHGIYPSTLCPFKADYSIDEKALATHIAAATAAPGIAGILCNGHAGENFLLDRAEQKRVIAIARETLGPRGIVVAGINHESSLAAAELARDAAAAEAQPVLVLAP